MDFTSLYQQTKQSQVLKTEVKIQQP